jgi:protein phosphatase
MIKTDSPHLLVAALSHPGEAREKNEDHYSLSSHRIEGEKTPAVLALVADGIGGHQAGEVASHLAIDTVEENLSASSGRQPIMQMREAILAAGKAISQSAAEKDELEGMGSTIAIAWVIGNSLYTGSVGDSRIYLLRSGELHQISIDHTWVQEALDYGVITPEEADDHPNAHVLRRHLGGKDDPEPDFRLRLSAEEEDEVSERNQGLQLNPGDRVLLCTDGLTDLVEASEIEQTLLDLPPKDAVRQLVDLARSRGGHDNITVVILAEPGKPGMEGNRSCLGKILLALIASGLLIFFIFLGIVAADLIGFWPW